MALEGESGRDHREDNRTVHWSILHLEQNNLGQVEASVDEQWSEGWKD